MTTPAKKTKNKTALILGITGQDGALMANFLLKKSYNVFGQSRLKDTNNLINLNLLKILSQINLKYFSVLDRTQLLKVISEIKPDEIYNFSGQSSVGKSYEIPTETSESIELASKNILEVIKDLDLGIKFFNAGSGECFGNTNGVPANEETCLRPISPYAVCKANALNLTSLYREKYNLFACTGIFFNHESQFRKKNFVTMKIVDAAIKIKNDTKSKITLGNIEVSRDWGWAEEYMEAAWLMINRKSAEDFIIATGVSQSLKDFAKDVFLEAGLNLNEYLEIEKSLFRKNEPTIQLADISKAKKLLSWNPKYIGKYVAKKMYHETCALKS
ncbi:MAG: GDP-mannose 4,6-dehydratase [Flavobacteriales bacterium]|nr:GDP-mannose 4,6-dehydratase [Flavobacteriales bacterium]|tara:strand:+ start:31 stop:1020 length:990 start_codon:yes stop_codon:yes gene_type:complete